MMLVDDITHNLGVKMNKTIWQLAAEIMLIELNLLTINLF